MDMCPEHLPIFADMYMQVTHEIIQVTESLELAWIMHRCCFDMSATYVEDQHLIIVLQVLNPKHAGKIVFLNSLHASDACTWAPKSLHHTVT